MGRNNYTKLYSMDSTKLTLINIEVPTILWVYEHEKKVKTFLVNLEVTLSPKCNFSSDNLSDTIDSWYLEESVRSACKEKNFNLLETMAHHICDNILKLERIYACSVKIWKPGCLEYTQSVEVEVHKST